ncbi:DUF5895 domain-containing protein [Gloeothece verrucosa]|uniref:DUF5895 domain-containing protein n=1 Tax=Gloeothece verrucosa (strain PCC 7822) TaxID=497965 RepID=E0UMD1_GLOV7|nr:DUF5895 domain-containing protein [Gloeothece verrucosa]ADN18111.1 hypothetical protein Cyan7822_6316 [Gloeothece verrucosa PCC 7822]
MSTTKTQEIKETQSNNDIKETEIDNETSSNIIIPPPELDEFCSPEYIDPFARLPRIQALRGATPDLCGYFVSMDQMAKAGWLDFEYVDPYIVDYTFESNGELESGVLLKTPRMLVIPRTPLLGYDREASQESQQLVILGPWKAEYKQEKNVSNLRLCEVFLLTPDNKPLHQVPLAYIAKGANGATFSEHHNQFLTEMTNCHAISRGIAARPKNNKFNCLCAFEFSVARELVGDKQKSFTCRVTSHTIPTLENWHTFFLGYSPEAKKMAWDGLQPSQPLMIPGQSNSVMALPAAKPEEE